MKPAFLFMCNIADANAKARMQKYIDITEIDEPMVNHILANIEGKEGLIVPYTSHLLVSEDVMDRGKSLKIIGTTYGGTRQNVADEYAIKKGLAVIHTGQSRGRPMAEYTLSMVLASLTQVYNYHHAMRSGKEWPRNDFGRTRILHQRKVGIVGFGIVGQAIASLFKCFTNNIAVRSNHASATELAKQGYQKLELEELFSECEIVILAGGYTSETHHLIRKRHFDLMSNNGLFVNVARGKIVDEVEMILALSSNRLFFALDVFEHEPLLLDSPLRKSDRVLLAPHRANAPVEFELRWQCLADEIEAIYTGKQPSSLLTLDRARSMSES